MVLVHVTMDQKDTEPMALPLHSARRHQEPIVDVCACACARVRVCLCACVRARAVGGGWASELCLGRHGAGLAARTGEDWVAGGRLGNWRGARVRGNKKRTVTRIQAYYTHHGESIL